MTTRLFTLASLVFLGACTHWEAPQTNTEHLEHMALSTNAIVPIVDPNSLVLGHPDAEIFEMASGTVTNKNDIDYNNQKIQNQIFTLADEKVDIAGDAMTGPLTIDPVGGNQTALETAGTGTGLGGIFIGGANGRGARSEAGGGNNNGHEGIGAGTGAGVRAIGGTTGPGLSATGNAGDNTAIAIYSAGGMRIEDTAPAASANPGADATIWSQSIVTATAIVQSDGAGNYVVRNNKGLNVASFSGNSSGVGTVTFARNLPGNDYRMHIDAEDGFYAKWNGVQNVGNFQFVVRSQSTHATVDLTTTAVTISVTTIGF